MIRGGVQHYQRDYQNMMRERETCFLDVRLHVGSALCALLLLFIHLIWVYKCVWLN